MQFVKYSTKEIWVMDVIICDQVCEHMYGILSVMSVLLGDTGDKEIFMGKYLCYKFWLLEASDSVFA